MSAIKTPVRVFDLGERGCGIRDANGDVLARDMPEGDANNFAAALNATLGIGLSVEALEQGVVERMVSFLREMVFNEDNRYSDYAERNAIITLINAAPNSEAGHD